MSNLAVIFDMDGVLIDSVSLNWQAMNVALARYNIHIADNELARYIGRNLEDQVAMLNHDFGVKIDYDAFLIETNTVKATLFADIQPKPGVKDLLQMLLGNSVPLAVATSSSHAAATQRLTAAKIIDYFDVIITEEDVSAHKPDPEAYIAAATALHISPHDCVVFEDAPTGIQAAKAAGMRCIAVQTKLVPCDMLQAADKIVDSLTSITLKDLQS